MNKGNMVPLSLCLNHNLMTSRMAPEAPCQSANPPIRQSQEQRRQRQKRRNQYFAGSQTISAALEQNDICQWHQTHDWRIARRWTAVAISDRALLKEKNVNTDLLKREMWFWLQLFSDVLSWDALFRLSAEFGSVTRKDNLMLTCRLCI